MVKASGRLLDHIAVAALELRCRRAAFAAQCSAIAVRRHYRRIADVEPVLMQPASGRGLTTKTLWQPHGSPTAAQRQRLLQV